MNWRQKYTRRLNWTDAFVIVWAVLGAFVIRFGLDDTYSRQSFLYAGLAILIVVAWWLMLRAWGSRDTRLLGAGVEEYKSVVAASLWLFGLVAIVSFALHFQVARGFVGLALPCGVLGLLASRWLHRQHLHLERRLGKSGSRVLVVGDAYSASHLVESLEKYPNAGYFPVAQLLPEGRNMDPSLGPDSVDSNCQTSVQRILHALEQHHADTVAVTAGGGLSPRELRHLGWELAARQTVLILAPALTDVAGPRIHTQPVAGLPLIHVSTPRLSGGKSVVKRSFDVIVSLLLIVLLFPLFLLIMLSVKLSGPGPVFYKQERIGVLGSKFEMVKFRSMISDADEQLSRLLAEQGSADKPLFKLTNDPRVTSTGRILRKYSLDELPQLINVLRGEMSLVGPRPQRESEVALYDRDAHRRLYVKPGMSGLWQVSGRSDLSWEESIRLDLYYVENWSLINDLLILAKTFRAVFAGTGAR